MRHPRAPKSTSIAVAAMMAAISLFGARPARAQAAPTITATPRVVGRFQNVTITGHGFAPNARLVLTVYGTQTGGYSVSGGRYADTNGDITTGFQFGDSWDYDTFRLRLVQSDFSDPCRFDCGDDQPDAPYGETYVELVANVPDPPLQTCTADQVRATQRYWFFGQNGAIDFDITGTTATPFLGSQDTLEGSTVVTDTTGTLQFWSNGQTVFDRNSEPMPNGGGLLGSPSATQAVAAFPALGQPGVYFVVTNSADVNGAPNGSLSYSVVDMSLNGGLGDVTTKNEPLGAANTASEALAAVPNADGTGFWVVTYTNESPNFLTYAFDDSGPVTGTPVVSELPTSNLNWYGTINVSPDLTRLVALTGINGGQVIVRVLDFDATTGQVSERVSWNLPEGPGTGSAGYAADFSPSGDYVYATKIFGDPQLYRYDIASNATGPDIEASMEQLGSIGGQGGQVRRGPDGHMYVAGRFSTALSVVNDPDNATDPGFVADGFALADGAVSQFGLPHMVTGCPAADSNLLFWETFESTMSQLPTELSTADGNWASGGCQNGMIVNDAPDSSSDDSTGSTAFLLHFTADCPYSADEAVWRTISEIPVQPNTSYVFSYWSLIANMVGDPVVVLTQGVTPNDGGSITITSSTTPDWPAANTWVRRDVMFTTDANTIAVSLRINNANTSPLGNDFGLDDIRLEPFAAFDELQEGFDDITLLSGLGWVQVNNSTPLGTSSWFQGNAQVFPAHEGAPNGYIGANYQNAAFGGTISNWLITPEVTIVNGTELRFWTRKTPQLAEYSDRLEVRLSVAGASVEVGDTADSVGDFTGLLLTINENVEPGAYPEEWTEYVVTVEGRSRAPVTGRFAFRYWVPRSNSDYLGIDTVSVTQPGGQAASSPRPSQTSLGLPSVAVTGGWPAEPVRIGSRSPTGRSRSSPRVR